MLSHSCAIHALPHFKIRSSSQSKTLGSTLNRKTSNLESPWVNFPSQDYVLAKEKKKTTVLISILQIIEHSFALENYSFTNRYII